MIASATMQVHFHLAGFRTSIPYCYLWLFSKINFRLHIHWKDTTQTHVMSFVFNYSISLIITNFTHQNKSFRTELIVDNKINDDDDNNNNNKHSLQSNTRVMVAKITRLTHKIAIQLHLVAESCTICSSHSRQPVQKLLDTPLYIAWALSYEVKIS
jgi:hypothetical protein